MAVARGVGIIGAGPGVAALHLPTLARLAGVLHVAHIADAGSGRAQALAALAGARSSAGIETLLADPGVEIVVICSPPDQHAEHILASLAAGKRSILCEKPLALTARDAETVIEACREAGAALLVGTNHYFDFALGRAKHHLAENGGRADSISITAALPPNDRYHAVVTEQVPGAEPVASRPALDWRDRDVAATVLRSLVLGLAVHDVPAVRDLAPTLERVVFARPVPPIGYMIGYIAGGVRVQLTAVMLPAGADALWRMSIANGADRIDIEFPPAFVHSGSATVTVRFGDGRITRYAPSEIDGYVEEWRALLEIIDGGASTELDEILADALYAIELANAVAETVRGAEVPNA